MDQSWGWRKLFRWIIHSFGLDSPTNPSPYASTLPRWGRPPPNVSRTRQNIRARLATNRGQDPYQEAVFFSREHLERAGIPILPLGVWVETTTSGRLLRIRVPTGYGLKAAQVLQGLHLTVPTHIAEIPSR